MGMTIYTFAWKLRYLSEHLPDSVAGKTAQDSINLVCEGRADGDEVTVEFPNHTMITVAETMARIGGLPSNAAYGAEGSERE